VIIQRMQREEKSERSRRVVLDASLDLFARHGYRATSVRDIAEAAGVSTGNVYHHFPDKEAIFMTLLDELLTITDTRRFPFRRALINGQFPDNLEELGAAARESIREFRRHFILVYVDVLEFDGSHIRRFYGEMAQRFEETLGKEGALDRIASRLRPGVSPISALMLTTRLFFSYFTIEVVFNVPEPFGKNTAEVVREIADILRNGMVG
jgi:AcrR family transcriptional regulator